MWTEVQERQIKTEILAMFRGYRIAGSSEDRECDMLAYLRIFEGTPADSLVAALRKAQRGNIGNPPYMPSAAQICQEAERIAARDRPMKRISPPSSAVNPEMQIRVGKMLFDLSAQMAASGGKEKAIGDWRPLRPSFGSADKLSPEAMKIFNQATE